MKVSFGVFSVYSFPYHMPDATIESVRKNAATISYMTALLLQNSPSDMKKSFEPLTDLLHSLYGRPYLLEGIAARSLLLYSCVCEAMDTMTPGSCYVFLNYHD
jgi:hypothetical protein